MKLLRNFGVRQLFVIVIALATTFASGDVIVRKDGSRITARVKTCDEERCFAEGQRISLEEIARIELVDAPAIPPVATAGSVVLTDGSIRRGTFTGLNLGFVYLGDEEISREGVAAIILASDALTAPGRPIAKDVLITGNGGFRTGSIERCNASSCVVDGETVPLVATRWIGLRQENNLPPPAPGDGDLIVLSDRQIAARLFALDGETLRTSQGSFPRRDVRWVRIAYSDEGPPSGPGGRAQTAPPSGRTPQITQPPPPPPPPQPPPTQPAPPAPAPAGSGPGLGNGGETRGGLWTGTLAGRLYGSSGGKSVDLTATVIVRVREYTIPMKVFSGSGLKRVGTLAYLRAERSVIRNSLILQGPGVYCSGEGQMVATWTPQSASPSVLYDKRTAGDMTPMFGFDVPVGKAMYVVSVPAQTEHDPTRDQTYELDCGRGGRSPIGYFPLMAGRPALGPYVPGTYDPEFRYLEGGKMLGGYTIDNVLASFPLADDIPLSLVVSWAICREGVQCPEPQPVGDASGRPQDRQEKPDCTRLGALRQLMRELSDLSQQYHNALNEANLRRAAASDAIWGPEGALAKYFTSMLDLASQGLKKSAEALKNAIGYATTLMGMSGEGNLGDVYSAVKQMGYGPEDLLMSAAEKEGVKAAVDRANTYLAQTGDHQGALRAYAGSIERSEALQNSAKRITDALGLVTALNDYASQTSGLFDAIDVWRDAVADGRRIESDIADVQRRIEEALREIEALQKELGNQCAPGAASLIRPSRYRYASLSMPVPQTSSAESDPADPSGLDRVSDRLRKQIEQIERVPALFEAATPWLLPFALDLTEGVDRSLLAAMLQQAAPHLSEVSRIIDEARSEGESIKGEIEKAKPAEGTSTKQRKRAGGRNS